MSLQAPEKVQKLEAALHAKAKESPGFRFYALYDKVYRQDVLGHASMSSKRSPFTPDAPPFARQHRQAYGVERLLGELAEALRSKAYQAQPVRRVMIPKANGQSRPLGIPTIRDRRV